MEYERMLQNWVEEHREEMISFLQTILRIPSVTGTEGEIQEFLSGYLKEMGAQVDFFVP